MEKRDSRPLYAAALTAAAVVLAVRAMYGFCWSDESFYLTFAQRLWNGQKLILDEWHPVQFYSALFHPILSLYHVLFGNRGIYLFAREVYVALAFGTAMLLYRTLCRKCAPFTSFLCAGLFLWRRALRKTYARSRNRSIRRTRNTALRQRCHRMRNLLFSKTDTQSPFATCAKIQ